MPQVIRSQRGSDSSWVTKKEYKGYLRVERITLDYPDHYGYLVILFGTNPDGQRGNTYDVRVFPREFAEVARAMMEADPTAAIKAFGAAMQDVPEISKAAHSPAAA